MSFLVDKTGITMPDTPTAPRSSHPYHLLMSLCGGLAAVTFGLMSLLVTADVILRNLNINIIPASVEITEYMLMVATFIAAPWLLYHGGHIRIDVLVHLASAPLQRILSLFCNVIGLVVCGILAMQTLNVLLDVYQQGSVVFKELVFPEWWLSLPLLIGSTLLTIEFVRRIRIDLRKKG